VVVNDDPEHTVGTTVEMDNFCFHGCRPMDDAVAMVKAFDDYDAQDPRQPDTECDTVGST